MDLTGEFIVSMPSMQDERFLKTVIFICAHSKEGAMGFIINKKIDFELYPDLLEKLGVDKSINTNKFFLRHGGPLERSRGFILHSNDIVKSETLNINNDVALTSTAELFDELAKGKGPKKSILALGYAGWGPGQLESEIIQNSWMTFSIETSFLFDDELSNKWTDAYKKLGINPSNLTSFSGKA